MSNDATLVLVVLSVFAFLVFLLVRNDKKSGAQRQPDQDARRNTRGRQSWASDDRVVLAKPSPSAALSVVCGPAYVIDGDSLRICKTEVRLFGVDAPEMKHPFGKSAKFALMALCKGQSVRAELVEIDVHGRSVARCYLADGRDLSAEMVKCGLALDWSKFSAGVYKNLEPVGVRKKLWLADARQKGRMDVWARYEARQTKVPK